MIARLALASARALAGLRARRARLRGRLREPVGRQGGVALVMVTVTIAVLGAVVSDFAYNARVDLEAAANARDQLRAEYLARSGIQLARLLIKVQQSVLDRNRQFVGDVQIAEFAPYLIKAFGGEADEREGLGALLGLDVSAMKGMGAGKGASFDLEMTAEDGKLNLNCGGGFNDASRQVQLYSVLSALFWPPRYNRLFETSDADGQLVTRDDLARAILDWADVDENRFEPTGSGSGAEDYRYDASRDPYRAHNHFFDTAEEVNLVRGVGDEVWGSFGELFTVYGGCKVNVNALRSDQWPLMAAILRASAKDERKTDPVLLDDVLLAQLAQQVMGMSKMMGGFQNTQQFVNLVTDPKGALKSMMGGALADSALAQVNVPGLPVDGKKLGALVTLGPRRVWRLDATGSIQRTQEKKIQVHIRAVWDTAHFNQNSTSGDANDRLGTWVYWRED